MFVFTHVNYAQWVSLTFLCMYILYFYHIHRLLSPIVPLSHLPLFHVHVSCGVLVYMYVWFILS